MKGFLLSGLNKIVVIAIVLIVYIQSVYAQAPASAPKGNGRVFGVAIDSATSQPVEFVNVVLIDAITDKPVNGALGDVEGKFSITKVAKGNYKLSISFVGYSSKTIDINLADSKSEIDLGQVKIVSSAKMLNEVVVQGQKSLVEERVDRMVYNAENDLTTKGGDASDVLKRVPLLSVDIDGNVALRGSTNVLVLINNKPSTITASSVADALKQIPADMIKNVEVITAPSSKYDAEGSAGIINIVLKKNTLQGVFFNVDGSAGNRGSSLSLNGNFRKRKMGFSLGSFTRPTYNVISDFINKQTTMNNGDTLVNLQGAHNHSDGLSSQYSFGWDYDINKNNTLTASVRYGQQTQNAYQDQLFTQTFQGNNLISSSLKNAKNTTVSNTIDASLTYTKVFAKKDREMNFMAIYSKNSPTAGFVTNTIKPEDNTLVNSYKNENHGYTEDMTVQLDFKEPITKHQTIEFGGKNIRRNVSTDYKYLIADGPNGDYHESTNTQLTNGFNYNQNITGSYISYTLATDNGYTFRAGSRYEYTSINAFFVGQPSINIPSYGVMVPSFNISKKLKGGNLIRAAYTRRIQRPSLRDLNPNIQASNPLNATQGNPHLKPEYTDNYEVAYNTAIKGNTISLSAYIRNNTNDIQQARSVRGDTIIAITQNIGSENNYGASAFITIPFSNRFSLSGGTDMYYRILKNNSNNPLINASNRGLTENFRLSGNYNFAPSWTGQFFSSFQGKQFNLQGYRTSVITHSVSIKKDIWKKSGSIGLGIDNFFTPTYKVYSVLHSSYIDQSTTTTLHNFIVRVNFSYKIGKLKVEERRDNGNQDD